MTNFEKFKKEIKALKCDFGVTKTQDIVLCHSIECTDCIFYSDAESFCDPTKIRWLYEEYKENITLTKEEKDFLKILWGSSYIARDRSGQLFLHSVKPKQISDCWIPQDGDELGDEFEICPDFFEFITWDSDKCWSVTELLRMPVKE